MHAIYYPPADRTTQWFGLGNATVAPIKVLWHTTETAGGWPGYSDGAHAPNLTYEPWRHQWRQHFPLNDTARALKNGTTYRTNRQAVTQVEVSCYCDPAKRGSGRGVERIDAQAYDDMGRFAEFMRAEWGIPLVCSVRSLPYPASYGANGVRLGEAAFTAYRGHLSHQHAVHNDHGDAGILDIARIITQGDEDMALTQDEITKIAAAVWERVLPKVDLGAGSVGPAAAWVYLTHTRGLQGASDAQIMKLLGEIRASGSAEALAAAIASHLPAELAHQVVDALAARLSPSGTTSTASTL